MMELNKIALASDEMIQLEEGVYQRHSVPAYFSE